MLSRRYDNNNNMHFYFYILRVVWSASVLFIFKYCCIQLWAITPPFDVFYGTGGMLLSVVVVVVVVVVVRTRNEKKGMKETLRIKLKKMRNKDIYSFWLIL